MSKTNLHLFTGKSFSKRIAPATQNGCIDKKLTSLLVFSIVLLVHLTAHAQDGNAGITEATMRIRSYFATGTSLMYAIGSVVGLVGAVKVFQKWNSGDQDTGKVAAAWFGSCVFLVIVATVLRSFFGV